MFCVFPVIFSLFFIVLFSSLLFSANQVDATSPPAIITYQGKLLENSQSVTTTKSMGFLIYDSLTGGNLLYTAGGTLSSTSTINITPTQGVFSVALGDTGTNSIATSTFANNHTLYLEVIISGTVLSPRKRLNSVPYAINSEYLMGISATSTSSSTYIPISDANGNFKFSGNSQSTLVSGGLIYIDPTSTISNGTLFGLAVAGVEKFKIDANGNAFASGSLRVAGLSNCSSLTGDASGIISCGTGAAFTSAITVTDGITTSSLRANGFSVATSSANRLGLFNIDSDGSVSTSGSLILSGLGTFQNGFISGSSSVTSSLTVSGALNASNTLLVRNSIIVNQTAGTFDRGTFFLDPNGAITTSGTVRLTSSTAKLGVASSSPAYNLSVSGTAFISGTTTFTDRVDIKGKATAPIFTTRITGIGRPGNMVVRGDYAFVSEATQDAIRIIDISSPDSLTNVATIASSTANKILDAGTMTINGNYLYILNVSTTYMTIYDVSNPALPILVSTTAMIPGPTNNATDIVIQGNYAYVTGGSATDFRIYDITDPYNVRPMGIINNNDQGMAANALANPTGVVVVGKYAYIASGAYLVVIDISDPLNPIYVGSLNNTTVVAGLAIQGKYAYIASGGGTGLFSIVDLSNKASPVLVTSTSNINATNLSGNYPVDREGILVAGNYAYIAGTQGVSVFDITSSSHPFLTGMLANGNAPISLSNVVDLAIRGNYLFFTDSGASSFVEADITGAVISTANIGAASVGRLDVSQGARFNQGVYILGGLTVGNSGLSLNGDLSITAVTSSISATNTIHFSHHAYFFVSSTTGTPYLFDSSNQVVSSTAFPFLSVQNNGMKLFSIQSNGDVRASGTLYAHGAIIGTPGAPGDLAERVDIASDDTVEAGDVMMVDPDHLDTYRRTDQANEATIAGVISTNPTITVGNGRTSVTAPMAMVGRVPVKVSGEAGPISRGDLLVSASKPGFAMRYDPQMATATVATAIIGLATDDFIPTETTTTGSIMVLLRPGWVESGMPMTTAGVEQRLQSGATSAGISMTNPETLGIGRDIDGSIVFLGGGNLNLAGFSILNVASIVAANDAWEIDAHGRFITKVDTSAGKKELFALQSASTDYVLSGSDQLQHGQRRIDFDATTKELIDPDKPIKVVVTPTTDSNGLYVSIKDKTGFTVQESNHGTDDSGFDWVVVASRISVGQSPNNSTNNNVSTGNLQNQQGSALGSNDGNSPAGGGANSADGSVNSSSTVDTSTTAPPAPSPTGDSTPSSTPESSTTTIVWAPVASDSTPPPPSPDPTVSAATPPPEISQESVGGTAINSGETSSTQFQ